MRCCKADLFALTATAVLTQSASFVADGNVVTPRAQQLHPATDARAHAPLVGI